MILTGHVSQLGVFAMMALIAGGTGVYRYQLSRRDTLGKPKAKRASRARMTRLSTVLFVVAGLMVLPLIYVVSISLVRQHWTLSPLETLGVILPPVLLGLAGWASLNTSRRREAK